MAIQPMALQVQNVQGNALGAFAQGQQHAQQTRANDLELAQRTLQNVGSLAFGVMGGRLDGQPDPARWEEALDLIGSQGVNVDMFRGRPDLAPIIAKASVDVLGQLNNNLNERELAQRMAEFDFQVQQALKGPAPTANMQDYAMAQKDPGYAEFLGKGPGGKTPDSVRALELRAEMAGLKPGTPEYRQFMVSGGSGGTSLSFDPATGALSFSQGGGARLGQTIDTGLGGEYVTMQQDALAAMRGMASLDAMEQAMADPGFYSGFGSDQIMGLKRAAAAIGIDPEGVTSMETFGALSKQAALDAMGGSLGTGFSNADRDFVEQQVPTLANTPEGNRALLGIQRKLQQRKIDIANLAEQYRLANGNMTGFVQFLSEWAEANPVFVSTQQSAAPQSSPASIDDILKGYGL
jgi:hypothetical protein